MRGFTYSMRSFRSVMIKPSRSDSTTERKRVSESRSERSASRSFPRALSWTVTDTPVAEGLTNTSSQGPSRSSLAAESSRTTATDRLTNLGHDRPVLGALHRLLERTAYEGAAVYPPVIEPLKDGRIEEREAEVLIKVDETVDLTGRRRWKPGRLPGSP